MILLYNTHLRALYSPSMALTDFKAQIQQDPWIKQLIQEVLTGTTTLPGSTVDQDMLTGDIQGSLLFPLFYMNIITQWEHSRVYKTHQRLTSSLSPLYLLKCERMSQRTLWRAFQNLWEWTPSWWWWGG